MNVVDKIIEFVNPKAGLNRTIARKQTEILNSGYSHHGASRNKNSLKGWNSYSSTARNDINDNIDDLRERSRDLYMGAPIGTAAIKTMRTNVVGAGLTLKPNIDYKFLGMTKEEAEQWQDAVKREFGYYADSVNCDIMRLNNFYELQQLAFLSQMMNGDVFVLLPVRKNKFFIYDLRIQLIEADMVTTPNQHITNPNISAGVEVVDNEVVAYYIRNCMEDYTYDTSYTRVEAFGGNSGRKNILHLMNAERVGQTRGVPLLAPVIESLKQLERYTHAELVAAVVGGMFTVFVKQTSSADPIGEAGYDDYDDDEDVNYNMGNGTIVNLGKDEDIEIADPKRPNANFDGFVRSIVKQIGASLEIPYELLMKSFESSYSASRASLLEAWKMFRMHRTWMANDFCQPIYEEWLSEAVAKGRIHAPAFFEDPMVRQAYCKAEWYGASQGQIDPLKEVKASEYRINLGVSTREREAMELTGTEFSSNIEQLKKEDMLMSELGGGKENKK